VPSGETGEAQKSPADWLTGGHDRSPRQQRSFASVVSSHSHAAVTSVGGSPTVTTCLLVVGRWACLVTHRGYRSPIDLAALAHRRSVGDAASYISQIGYSYDSSPY
jgi:hypothetical protein